MALLKSRRNACDAKLRVQKGDTLYVSETADGIELSPYDPEFEQEIETARAVMRRYRNALRQLAT